MKKRALILGITGQDGSYLSEILLAKNYEVHGMYRKSSTGNTSNIDHLLNDPKIFNISFFLHRGDLLDQPSLFRIISDVKPDEIYNEADQDHVKWSFEIIGYSSDVTSSGVAKLLETVRIIDKSIRVFQPVTSNMFGFTREDVLNEDSTLNPQSPYAIGKTFAFHTARLYRNAYGMHVSTAILFNHESPRRTTDYVTRKISRAAAKISLGLQNNLVLGDTSALIDWGHARDYMVAAVEMLQQPKGDDFVICSGELNSVQSFLETAFNYVNLNWKDYVSTSKEFYRPTRTSSLKGDSTKALNILKFKPSYGFEDLVIEMVEHDLADLKKRS